METLTSGSRRGAPRGSRSLAQRVLRWLACLALAALAIEAASRLMTAAVAGNPFTGQALAAERDGLAVGMETGNSQGQTKKLYVVPHPYFGFVFNDTVNKIPAWVEYHQGHGVNRFGFEDSNEFLQKRAPDTVIVGITGGSVAWWLSAQGEEDLAATLRESPRFAGKEVSFVRCAAGGYKQPQQLMILSSLLALGGELDILVNLDGCNEVSLSTSQTMQRGVYPFFPREWDLLVDAVSDVETSMLVGRVAYLSAQRQRWAEACSGPLKSRMRSLQIAWKLRDKLLERALVEARMELQSLERTDMSFAARGPGIEGFDDATVYDEIADVWVRSSLQMHALCEANGIEYFHFLQPNQYVPGSKPIGEEESAVAITPRSQPNAVREAIERGYPLLLEQSGDLLAAGVRFTDLRMVFAGVEEPLYIDAFCHVNKLANRIMGQRIGQEILSALGEPTFEAFAPREWAVALGAPDSPTLLAATGRFSDGELRALVAAGIDYRSSAPDVISVSRTGELVAHRLGSAVIEMTRGGERATVDVRADWGPVLEVEPGDGGDAPPRLVVPDGGPTLGDQRFHLPVTGVPAEAQGVLLAGWRPPSAPSAQPKVFLSVPLVRSGTAAPFDATAPLPVPDDPELAGQPIYCRAVCFENGPDGPHGVAWSYMLVLTVR